MLASKLVVPMLAAAMVLCVATSATAATRTISPLGSDSGDCILVPCKSFTYAYNRSADGDVIVVSAGRWGDTETVPEGSKRVTFQGAPGNSIYQVINRSDNVTFDGLDVDGKGAKINTFYDSGNRNWTFKNGRIGNIVDEKGALLAGSDTSTDPAGVVIDNVVFHDVLAVGEGVHNECVMTHSPGITIRNSLFTNCATMDVSLGLGWTGQQPYGNVTLENNVFGHSVNGNKWHYYGLAWYANMFRNARVVNNTFENAVLIERSHIGDPPYSGVWANNLGTGWICLAGVVYEGNVGTKCGASDKAMAASSLPANWVDPLGVNFRLKPTSPAIGAARAAHAPALDRDGFARDARPDAGAHEFGAGPPVAGGPGTGGGGSASWRIARARLLPKVICRSPRRGCPSSAKLRLRLGRPAKLSVRVQRVRKGGKVRRVRSLARKKVMQHKALRIRARGLRAGRYRLRIVATDATGARSAVAVLRLRVR